MESGLKTKGVIGESASDRYRSATWLSGTFSYSARVCDRCVSVVVSGWYADERLYLSCTAAVRMVGIAA